MTLIRLILSFLVFCITLFVYHHVYFHLKTSNDLEIFELSEPSQSFLDDMCNSRQPLIIYHASTTDSLISLTRLDQLVLLHPAFEVQLSQPSSIFNTLSPHVSPSSPPSFLPIPLHAALTLLRSTTPFLSEHNSDFLHESGLDRHFRSVDSFLRPSMTSNVFYDLLFGSTGFSTPLRYEVNFRSFFIVTQGLVDVRLTPPRSSRHFLLHKLILPLKYPASIACECSSTQQ